MTVKFRRVKVREYNNAYQFILLIEISAMKDRFLNFFYHYDSLESNRYRRNIFQNFLIVTNSIQS